MSLTVTSKRVISKTGIFSNCVSEVRHQDVRNIQMWQNFLQRRYDVGAIAVSTAARNEAEVQVHGIKNPEQVRRLISDLRDKAQGQT
jgi:uncharacterized membrane protein YdbT with pleckstrin-like domain